jgi:uncharacterized membrane protein YgdD (TMEM256/DUF423 family)
MKIGAILGFFAVLLGAFGAHALRDSLSAYHKEVFQTAWNYHIVHALVLLSIPCLKLQPEHMKVCALIFLCGILIFSGSLYALAVTDLRWLGRITPIGGVLLLIGWAYLAIKIS